MSCSYKGDRKDLLDGVRSSPVLDRVIFGITYPVKIRSETQKRVKTKAGKLRILLHVKLKNATKIWKITRNKHRKNKKYESQIRKMCEKI